MTRFWRPTRRQRAYIAGIVAGKPEAEAAAAAGYRWKSTADKHVVLSRLRHHKQIAEETERQRQVAKQKPIEPVQYDLVTHIQELPAKAIPPDVQKGIDFFVAHPETITPTIAQRLLDIYK